ncbi:Phosphonate-transporting ATPase [Syntrophobotulus glycolicus DSM 8271]|uniref:Phosphonate-transporting ATPase n=1 Tax=Syntrophobotulus glycolicus (strain DSM 8271 / FlGlyR) TaxID=645991 RepID=F0T0Y3_SYNGF|nr:energy-coupling factor ABC transporter ATP-binding protein [Syntrophobotulus glycolicus]ADY57354.1 Phosphonate-transporting ATPase [Syntrophobotulus glycolicus DSM 8271]
MGVINVEGLDFTVADGKKILNKISFKIESGEFIALVGHNGAGKSSLIQHLNGLLKPERGKVSVTGLDPAVTRTSMMAKHIGFLFQNPDHQIFNITVIQEIMAGPKNSGLSPAEAEKKAKSVARTVGLSDKLEENPFALSRGDRQRLAFASVLAMNPEIMILDEPTTGLDFSESREIMEIIDRCNRQGTTIIMITHDMNMVLKYARRVLVLKAGSILADGPVHSVLRNGEILEEAGLLSPGIFQLAHFLKERGLDIQGWSVEELFEAMRKKLGV